MFGGELKFERLSQSGRNDVRDVALLLATANQVLADFKRGLDDHRVAVSIVAAFGGAPVGPMTSLPSPAKRTGALDGESIGRGGWREQL